MSAKDLASLAQAVERQLEAGAVVPEAGAAYFYAARFEALAQDDGLIGALEALRARSEADARVSNVVEGLELFGLDDAADAVATAWNWIEDGSPVDSEAGLKEEDVRDAMDARYASLDVVDALEGAAQERLRADPASFGL